MQIILFIYYPLKVKEAFGHRCITKLVDLLAFDELDPSNKAYALELLESMVSTQELKAEAQEAGAISCCVSLLQHDSQEVRRNASSLLGQLCLTRSGQLEMISTGGIRILTNLLQDNSIEVRESVARALCLLSISNEAANELVTEGIVPNLVRILFILDFPLFLKEIRTVSCLDRLVMLNLDQKEDIHNYLKKEKEKKHHFYLSNLFNCIIFVKKNNLSHVFITIGSSIG